LAGRTVAEKPQLPGLWQALIPDLVTAELQYLGKSGYRESRAKPLRCRRPFI
jgi:hypothetical protein